MKEKVVIEGLDDDKVTVYMFDDYSKQVTGTPINVCHRLVATDEYAVVGEIVNGELTLFDSQYEDEDYSEFSVVDEEEA